MDKLNDAGGAQSVARIDGGYGLDLGSSNLFNVNTSATDVRQQLMITGDADDKVVLTDLSSWTLQGSTYTGADSRVYKVYHHNTANAQLLIDQLITSVAAS